MTTLPIAQKDQPFLQKVMETAQLPDIYDARDITVIVFRAMRDLMTTEAADQTEAELQKGAFPDSENKALQGSIADLWKDTNPVVAFLSRIRKPLIMDSDLFLRRIKQEAGLPQGVEVESVVQAIFSATKSELSPEREREISMFLPAELKAMWDNA